MLIYLMVIVPKTGFKVVVCTYVVVEFSNVSCRLNAQWARKNQKVQAEKTREIKSINFTKFLLNIFHEN